MSRIRTIKPEFWSSGQIMDCSPLARLLFIGLWNYCDDAGIHPASIKRIKAEVFPSDNFSMNDIRQWVDELIQTRLIFEYILDEEAYWIVTGWKKHQRIDRPTYRHPQPQSQLKKIDAYSTTIPREIADVSLITHRAIDEPSTTEWKGMEGIGMEKEICEVKTSHADIFESNSLASIQEVFSHWQVTMNHPRAKLDTKRQNKVAQALKLGYSVEDLKQAINGCSMTPYNMGKNDNNQIYDDISLIFRDSDHIERFINNVGNNNKRITKDRLTELMAGAI